MGIIRLRVIYLDSNQWASIQILHLTSVQLINVEQAYVWSIGALQFHTNKHRTQFGDKHL